MQKAEFLYLVADEETDLILTSVPTASCAAGVTLGILNTFSFSISTKTTPPGIKDGWAAFDFNKDLYQIQRGKTLRIRKFPTDLVGDEVREKRSLAIRRGAYIHTLELYCHSLQTRIAEYMPEHLASYIQNELNNCDPSKRQFTKPIEEYAALQEIDADVAYQELQIKLQSSGMMRLRNYALYEKFMMAMNECTSDEELSDALTKARNVLIFNAYI